MLIFVQEIFINFCHTKIYFITTKVNCITVTKIINNKSFIVKFHMYYYSVYTCAGTYSEGVDMVWSSFCLEALSTSQ